MYETLLLKTDSLGNPVWEKFYQGKNGLSLQPFEVLLAPNKGYLITGLEKDLSDFTTNEPFLMRTDSTGAILWKRTIGSPGVDGYPSCVYLNSSIYACHSQETDSMPDPKTGYRNFQQVFTKLSDNTGAIIDQDTSEIVFPRMYGNHLAEKFNQLVAVGDFINFDLNKPGGSSFGYTLAIDTLLNPQWFKTYTNRGINAKPGDDNRLWDIRPTRDGGFVCAGYHQNSDLNGSSPSGFYAWLLKLDSLGCEQPNCINQISNDEVSVPKLGEIQVYPNPANDELNISVNGLAKGIVQLVDMRGVVLQAKALENGECVLQIDNMTSGFYLIRISNGKDFTSTHKVAIVH